MTPLITPVIGFFVTVTSIIVGHAADLDINAGFALHGSKPDVRSNRGREGRGGLARNIFVHTLSLMNLTGVQPTGKLRVYSHG